MARYTDLYVLLDDIAAYVRRTGHVILVADDPMTRSFGFAALEDNTVEWTIGLRNAMESLNAQDRGTQTLILWDTLRTTAGRQALASAMSRVGSLAEALPRVATETVIDPIQAALEPPQREPMPTVPEPMRRSAEERLIDDDILPS